MEFDNRLRLQEEDSSDGNIQLKVIIEKYLGHWKWFLIAAILAITIGYLFLNFERPQYEATSTIKIKNEQGGDRTALSAFQDLGIIAPANQNVEDEMEILLSKDLLAEVVKSLRLNVQLFSNKNKVSKFFDNKLGLQTNHYETEMYEEPSIEINFLMSDSILYNSGKEFIISIKSDNFFTYTDIESNETKRYAFGEKFNIGFGDIIVTPNTSKKNLIDDEILVVISSVKGVANAYSNILEIEPKSDFSSVLSLKVVDGVRKKAEDFLSELVKKYNEKAIYQKEELSRSTSDFVDTRLAKISVELSDVDRDVESIKTRYQISDVASETGLNMQSGQEIENQIVQANMQLETIGYVKEFVGTKNENDLIPMNVGIQDNNVNGTIQQYNQIMLQKKKMLETSTEKNPIVVNLNEQLRTLKSNIDQGLNNLESAQKISIEALNQQDRRINARLYSAPRQERQYRNIQRQQQIKEALYLYLLEKREETALTLGVVDPNAKIIDSPLSTTNPISPNKLMTYIGFLILGLMIPFVVILIREMIDTRIHTREDVEKVLNIPIIGDIPKFDSKTGYFLKKDDYSGIAEAFRILRTNLNFILPKSNENAKGKVVFITSTIAHEGKSSISTNLAVALSHGGKKTLLLGMDIRAPKLKNKLGINNTIGVTNYIINSDINPEDLITHSENTENLDIILSGDIAPNPAELLMNPRVAELFKYGVENYEYIIVDTAAFSMVTDTMLLSKYADAFIYIIRTNFLDKRFLKYINSLYKDKRLPNMSLLINAVDHKKSYGYGYGYGYGTEFNKTKKPWWKFS